MAESACSMDSIPCSSSSSSCAVSSQSATDATIVPEAVEVPKKLTKKEKSELYTKSYGEPIDTWREIIKSFYKKDNGVVRGGAPPDYFMIMEIMYKIFEEADNPYVTIINLYKACPAVALDKEKFDHGLLMEYFDKWLNKQDDPDQLYQLYVTEEIKRDALAAATLKNTSDLQLFARIFRMKETSFIPFVKTRVKELIESRDYKECLGIVSTFDLYDYFNRIEDFIIPLILQDKAVLVTPVFKSHPELTKKYILFLDNLVGKDDAYVERFFKPYMDKKIMKISCNRFTTSNKSLTKLIKSISTELLQIDLMANKDLAPKYRKHSVQKEIRYQAHKRFQAAGAQTSDDVYFGVMRETLQQEGPDMVKYLIDVLVREPFYELDDALRWAVFFGIPDHLLPDQLVDYIAANPAKVDKAEEEIRTFNQSQLDDMHRIVELFPGYPIRIVRTFRELDDMIDVMAEVDIIGLDSEWMPQFKTSVERYALFQIALDNAVYLVDFVSLEEIMNQDRWEVFLNGLLKSNSIKIGFDFRNDIRALFNGPTTKNLKHMDCFEEMKNVVCLKRLVENLILLNESFKEFAVPARPVKDEVGGSVSIHFSLNDLSRQILGSELDKKEQCSNWAARPLRPAQQIYAAMDAYVLLQIYDKLKEKALKLGIDWNTVLIESHVYAPKKEKDKAKKTKNKLESYSSQDLILKLDTPINVNKPRKKARDVMLVVDTMFNGLGKQLRHIGIDVEIPESREILVSKCEKNWEKRTIISCGTPFETLRQRYPNRTICVHQNSTMIEQVKAIIQYFNVQICINDLFSRCVECNCAAFVRAPAPVMEALYESAVTCIQETHDELFQFHEWALKLSDINPSDYGGIGCRLEVIEPDWMIAHCDGGSVHISKNIVVHNDLVEGEEIQISKVMTNSLSVTGRFFYICGECGKVYWDGSHSERYASYVNEHGLLSTDRSESPTNEESILD